MLMRWKVLADIGVDANRVRGYQEPFGDLPAPEPGGDE
jgi:hypothetical protein